MGLFDKSYMKVSGQAAAVRAYLDCWDGVQASYTDADGGGYQPVHIAEWYNERERGYVLMFTNADQKQLNIAFFEHRNSDDICALVWEQSTINPPTIDTAEFSGLLYKNKYGVSHSVSVGKAMEMADWIMEQLEAHWTSAQSIKDEVSA